MFTTTLFRGKTNITRRGLLHTLSIPAHLASSLSLDMVIDDTTGVMSFTEGPSVYGLVEYFGIKEETFINMFFVDGGMFVELLCGQIYLTNGNGVVYSINEDGGVEYPTVEEQQSIYWVYRESAWHNIGSIVCRRYNISTDIAVRLYLNNLAVSIIAENVIKKTAAPCFRFKVESFFTDLGLGRFSFSVLDSMAALSSREDDEGSGDTPVEECGITLDQMLEEDDEVSKRGKSKAAGSAKGAGKVAGGKGAAKATGTRKASKANSYC